MKRGINLSQKELEYYLETLYDSQDGLESEGDDNNDDFPEFRSEDLSEVRKDLGDGSLDNDPPLVQDESINFPLPRSTKSKPLQLIWI